MIISIDFIQALAPDRTLFLSKNPDIFFLFLPKTYTVGIHLNCLTEMIFIKTYNIFFHGAVSRNIYLATPFTWSHESFKTIFWLLPELFPSNSFYFVFIIIVLL